MADDIASLGLSVDSSKVKNATSDLDKFTEASKKAEKAASDLGNAGGRANDMSKKLGDSAKAGKGLADSLSATRVTAIAMGEALGALTVGALAFGAGALFVSEKWGAGQRDIERALIGIGQRTGETLQSIGKFTSDNASLTGLSVTQARQAALEFTKTGDIAVSSLTGVGDAIHGFAVLTGTDATKAAKEFTGALSGDLVKGAEKLNQTYGTMNSATLDLVRTLEMQGNRTAAVQVIIDSISDANKKAADSVSFLSKAYDVLGNVMDRVIHGPATPASGDDGTAGRQLAALQKQRSALTALPDSIGGTKALDDLDRKIDELQRKINAFNTDKVTKELNGFSVAGDAVVRSIIPQIDQINNLQMALDKLQAAQNTPGVSRSLGQDDSAVVAIQNQLAGLRDAQAEAARYNQQVQEISGAWGNVSQATALSLQQLQNQLPVAQAVTGADQMRAQYQATINNLLMQGKSAYDATAIAAKQLELSQALATTSVMKQVEALKDSTEMIKAQVNGNEARVAAEIAYKNALASGADSMSASALSSATLDNYIARANASSERFANNMTNASGAASQISESLALSKVAMQDIAEASSDAVYEARHAAALAQNIFAPDVMPSSGGSISGNPLNNVPVFYKNGGAGKRLDVGFTPAFMTDGPSSPDPTDQILSRLAADAYSSGGIDASIQAVMAQASRFTSPTESGSVMNQIGSMFDFKNSQTNDKSVQVNNLQSELALLNTLPETIARDQKLADLQNSIDQLRNSTDGLNSTNQDLLSPYYTQDPRTSHIGFRSQGMAAGGYVDVPGSPSANDNMTAIIPVASGERIYVDPQSAKRGLNTGGGNVTNITINNHNIIGDRADKNEVGRTVYQSTQSALRQIRAAS